MSPRVRQARGVSLASVMCVIYMYIVCERRERERDRESETAALTGRPTLRHRSL